MTEEYEATLDEVPERYTFEESVKYKELSFWVRTEVVLCAGPKDVSPLSDCQHGHCGVRFPHTTAAMTKLAWYWGGENGAN
jgi:hypothetical protein